MTRTELLTELRHVINDDSAYPEWAESTLLGYLSEGQDKFCEDTGYFLDLTNFTFILESGVSVYEISDLVIEIIDIWYGSTKLTKLLTGEANPTQSSGMPTKWRADQATGSIVLYPTPTDTEDGLELILQVWRYSLEDLADTGAEPEIPPRFQRALIEWAAYKAFNHHDAETQDPVKASEHLAAYKMYVRDAQTAFRRQHGLECRVTADPAYRT